MSFALAGRLSQRVRLPKALPWAECFRPCRAFRAYTTIKKYAVLFYWCQRHCYNQSSFRYYSSLHTTKILVFEP